MYRAVYHTEVVKEDIPKIPPNWREKIKNAIEDRLVEHPYVFGKPLRKSLKNYRKLRVGDYRVVFRIDGKVLKIFAIMHRSVVYKKISKREEF